MAEPPKRKTDLPALERCIERMNLNNPSNGQGSDLHQSEVSKVAGFQNAYIAPVGKENVRLIQQCMPVHGPETLSYPIVIQRPAMIGIVHMMIIDRCQPHQKDGAAEERPGSLRIAEKSARHSANAL
jgi:hypothetical protein